MPILLLLVLQYYYCYNCTKDSRHISYRNQVIAHFVSNFVAVARGINRGKIWLAASTAQPQKPDGCKDLADISYRS